MFVFRNIWRASISCNNHFEIRPFSLLAFKLSSLIVMVHIKFFLRIFGHVHCYLFSVDMRSGQTI